MTENFQDKLHQEECKQSKGTSIRRELEYEKCSKNFPQNIWKTKYTKSNKCKNSSNSVEIFKSTKNVLERLNTKEDSSNTTPSKVLSKICNRKYLQRT